VTVLLVDLDRVLGDTRPLWRDWLAGAARLLPVDPAALPEDRGAAAAELDGAGAGNWRTLLERFAEDRAPVYLRPNAEATAALTRLARAGVRVAVFTDAPGELARIALGQLGAARRVDAVEAGAGALERLRAQAGGDATVVRTREQLEAEAELHAA
jgi:phosphoglycolate phosphatase-like HAD superfamily hydrolase